jgi:cell division septation protein DedD
MEVCLRVSKNRRRWVVALFNLVLCALALGLGFVLGNWVLSDLFEYKPVTTDMPDTVSVGNTDSGSRENLSGTGGVSSSQPDTSGNQTPGQSAQTPVSADTSVPPSPPSSQTPPQQSSTSSSNNTVQSYWYRVQVGHFADRALAETLLAELKENGYADAFITTVSKGYRVQVGSFSTNDSAEEVAEKLRSQGKEVFVVQVSK